jgi:UDP-N-acetylglucosamine 2-epimerase (non-hydrolysing)
MKLAIVLGTRPEILKLTPVIRACQRRDVEFSLIHTGQHYSEGLDEIFFETLDLPTPDHDLAVGSGSHGEQTGRMLIELAALFEEEDFDVVVVQGDTNTVLAGALAASKLDTELAHVEAGLRSYDWQMPEEINRRLTDHVSEYLFAPTEDTRRNLREEGLPDERIFVTGNTIVDTVLGNRDLAAEQSTVLEETGIGEESFILLTAHRAENVDDRDRFAGILDGVSRFAAEQDVTVLYPIHPRAQKQIEAFDLPLPPEIYPLEPLGYLEFLALEDAASLVFTDSGGVQEEACILGTPCVTVRDTTERPETVDNGANVLAGADPDSIVQAARAMSRAMGDWDNPFGDGDAGERILSILVDSIADRPEMARPAQEVRNDD